MCCNLKGTYLLSELAGQTDAVIKISLFLRTMQGNDSFSENFEKRLLLRFQNDRSGWPALTFDKRPYSLEHATDRVFVVSNGTMGLFRKTNLDPISRATSL